MAINIAFLLLDAKAHMPQLCKILVLEVTLLVLDLQHHIHSFSAVPFLNPLSLCNTTLVHGSPFRSKALSPRVVEG